MKHEIEFGTLEFHKSIFTKCLSTLYAQEDVEAVVLSGSFADGTVDEYSDIDLSVLLKKGFLESVFNRKRELAESIGCVATSFHANHLSFRNHMYVVFFAIDGFIVKVDFDFVTIDSFLGTIQKYQKRRLILFDKTGSLDLPKFQSELVNYEVTESFLLDSDSKFWGWLWYTYGKIIRGELFEAHDAIHSIVSLVINPMALSLAEKNNEGFRRIEEKYSQHDLEQLTRVYGEITQERLLRSLYSTVQLYLKLRRKIEKRKNIELRTVNEQIILNAIGFSKGKT